MEQFYQHGLSCRSDEVRDFIHRISFHPKSMLGGRCYHCPYFMAKETKSQSEPVSNLTKVTPVVSQEAGLRVQVCQTTEPKF